MTVILMKIENSKGDINNKFPFFFCSVIILNRYNNKLKKYIYTNKDKYNKLKYNI